MASFKDLLTSLTTNKATQASDATTLALATSAKAQSDMDVDSSTVAFASAIQAAPGQTVIDDTSAPFISYASTDGKSLTSTVVASINDPVPPPAVIPPAAS